MELVRTDAETQTKVMVEWTDLGEGIQGDYNPDDPEDIPLYRFDVSVKRKGDKYWEPLDDGSYCTQVPIYTDKKTLKAGLEMIMDEIFYDIVQEASPKRACERMSWISVDSIQRGVWERKWSI
jgi:hypothetical protein